MQHVILARDRRKKKNRLKVILFLSAIFSVCIGILLAVKNQTPVNEPEQQAYVALEERAPAATETQTETQTIVNDTPTESIKTNQKNRKQMKSLKAWVKKIKMRLLMMMN